MLNSRCSRSDKHNEDSTSWTDYTADIKQNALNFACNYYTELSSIIMNQAPVHIITNPQTLLTSITKLHISRHAEELYHSTYRPQPS
jgi:hypothetical protein